MGNPNKTQPMPSRTPKPSGKRSAPSGSKGMTLAEFQARSRQELDALLKKARK